MYYTKNMLASVNDKLAGLEDLESRLFNLGHEVEESVTTNLSNLVVGRIVSVSDHPDSDHLHVCSIDVNQGQPLQIVCGASNVAVDQLVIVAMVGAKLPHLEIKPTTIRGVESQGMLCALSELGLEESYVNPDNLDHIHIIADYESNVGEDPITLFGLNDTVYDVSLTANRGDCLSYYGIVRDLLASCNDKFEHPSFNINDNININVENNISGSVLLIENLENKVTPTWLKVFLAKHHLVTTNFINDYLTYLRIVTGQTYNVYDVNQLGNMNLSVKAITQDSVIKIDGKEYTLPAGSIVTYNNEEVIGIPAVTHVDGYGVDKDTTSVVIECLNLEPQTIRAINNVVKVKNENTIRSEKGVDVNAINNFTGLLGEMLANTNAHSSILYYHLNQQPPQVVSYDPTIVKPVLGIEVDPSIQYEILTNLGFEVSNNSNDVVVPSWRYDIEHDNDLVEEVIRVYGVDKVNSVSNVETLVTPNMLDHSIELLINKIANQLVGYGLNEIVTYSLVNEQDITTFNPLNLEAIKLASPLSKEHEYYRVSLIPSLLKVAQYNLDRQASKVNYFEIGNIYYNNNNNIVEEEMLTIALGGVNTSSIDGKVSTYTFNDIKNIVLSLFNTLGVSCSFTPINIAGFNHYALASINVGGESIGVIGLKHPNYYKKIKPDLYLVEINVTKLHQYVSNHHVYQPISNLPLIKRQITLIAKQEDVYADIIKVFNDINYLDGIKLVSVYAGDNLAPGSVSYSFELSFKQEEVLTNEAIEKSIETIINNITLLGYIFNQG